MPDLSKETYDFAEKVIGLKPEFLEAYIVNEAAETFEQRSKEMPGFFGLNPNANSDERQRFKMRYCLQSLKFANNDKHYPTSLKSRVAQYRTL